MTAIDKNELRRQARIRRDAMTEEERMDASEGILWSLLMLPQYEQSETIFMYDGFGSEPDTRMWARYFLQKGKKLAYPRTRKRGYMDFYRIESESDLVPGHYGIQEPDAHCMPVTPQAGDLILTPGLVFDAKGHRLGYGAGFYDRYKERFPDAAYIGAAYNICRTAVLIPAEPWDMTLDGLVTEAGIWQFKNNETEREQS
ncbi:MAG: 5-formyltetrahydrofolate cyclo-ligase [Firmicutes bacterium]|nr:5-formyltetrahydrofolate cyclo-ligase [Bacillota bacterium]